MLCGHIVVGMLLLGWQLGGDCGCPHSSLTVSCVTCLLMLQKVYPWLFLLEVILHQPLILQKIQIVTMVTLFKFSFANGRDYINNASSIVDMLKQSVPSNKEHRWQLFEVWLNLMSTLTDKVVKVVSVCLYGCLSVCLCVCACACVCVCVRACVCACVCVYG